MTSTSHYPTSSTCTKSTKKYIGHDASSPTAISNSAHQQSYSRNRTRIYCNLQSIQCCLMVLIEVIMVIFDINGINLIINLIINSIYGRILWYFNDTSNENMDNICYFGSEILEEYIYIIHGMNNQIQRYQHIYSYK